MIGLIIVLIVVIAWLCFKVDGLNNHADKLNNKLIENEREISTLNVTIGAREIEIIKLKSLLRTANERNAEN